MYTYVQKCDLKTQLLMVNTYWEKLPWRKISLRISMLINQIFLETKKHNLSYVHELQNYIINSNELKIFVLNNIILKLYFLYYVSKKQNNVLYNEFKINILTNVFNKKRVNNKNFITIKEQLKQNLIYICIQPLCEARSVKYFNTNNSFNLSYYLVNKHHYYLSNKYINKKLVLSKYIKNIIICLLNNIDYLDVSKLYHYSYKVDVNRFNYSKQIHNLKKFNFLIEIIDKLTLTDLNWHYFNQLKKDEKLKFHEDSHQKFENKKTKLHYLLKFFKVYVKSTFLLRKFKISNYLFTNLNQVCLLQKISYIYQKWYNTIDSFIQIGIISMCNLFMNQIIYLLTKKNIMSISNYKKNIYKINMLLNKFTYKFNLNRYYINYNS